MKLGTLVLALAVLGFAAWVRLAPSDPSRWHQNIFFAEDEDLSGGARRVVPGGDLAALDRIAIATPRTAVLAGSVAEGHITYVTRSALWGFPDYTTVKVSGDSLLIFGRLRFGAADLGVNAKRIDGWIAALGA